jgi:ribosomal protein L11 methylase PrmA
LLTTLDAWGNLVSDRRALDFGCSWGTSVVALFKAGARHVIALDRTPIA